MVAQIICMVCALAPDSTEKTTEITFHRFPCDENQSQIDAWRQAVTAAIGRDIEIELKNSYICSRHFKSDDFSFTDGKLILQTSAVPSVFLAKTMEGSCVDIDSNGTKVEPPPTHGNNFASTSTINFMTFSHNYPRTTSTCTETTKSMMPSAIVTLPSGRDGIVNDDALKILEANRIQINAYKRRLSVQQQKIKRMSNLLRQLRRDNQLTDEYMAKLSVSIGLHRHGDGSNWKLMKKLNFCISFARVENHAEDNQTGWNNHRERTTNQMKCIRFWRVRSDEAGRLINEYHIFNE